MKSKTLLLLVAFATVFFLRISPGLASDQDTCLVCGDADNSGIYDIGDLAYITSFLYDNGPAPGPCADIDGFDFLTVSDLLRANQSLPPICAAQSKIVPQPSGDLKISYIKQPIYPNMHGLTFNVSLEITGDVQIKAYTLPLIVRIDGEIPSKISAVAAGSTWPGSQVWLRVDSTMGAVILTHIVGNTIGSSAVLCQISIDYEPIPYFSYVTLEFGEFGPYMTGASTPQDSACHYLMFLDENLNAWEPTLESLEVCFCGDADDNSVITISDAVFLINFTFIGGPFPDPLCLADADGNTIITISDAVYLINFIFAGGPAPHCP